MVNPSIQAIGTANPPHKISQEKHYAILESANGLNREEKLRMKMIYSRSGIKYRHSVLQEFDGGDEPENLIFHPAGEVSAPISVRMNVYEEHASSLCLQAANECFEMLPNLKKEEITHLIAFSCTGMYAPGLDVQMVQQLGLQRSVERTCINFMGCYAAINALKTAYHISRSEPDAVVMLVGVELCSLHYQKSADQNQMLANALFSDGAAVSIVSCRKLAKDASFPSLRLESFYSEFDHSGVEEMVWRIGDAAFDLRLSPEVPNLVKGNIAGMVSKLLHKAGLKQIDIDYYAIHPGGVKILEACEKELGITKEDNEISYEVLSNYGNMSSVTILFVLSEYMKRLSADYPGKKIMACAFGPGLTIESMIIETC
ncbi:MAG: type III polyketide synthase [Sphingobacteriales bacterium]|nr:MAG: type III polyketide synthase [Sphingobacteriales bacterium]